jgi:hypothetical protein
MLSLYVTLGIFLLIAARNPMANRSLIAFTAWSSFAHATVMAVQAFRNVIGRGELAGRGCPRCHRLSVDHTGSGRAVRRAPIGSRRLGSHSGETANPDIPPYNKSVRSSQSRNASLLAPPDRLSHPFVGLEETGELG